MYIDFDPEGSDQLSHSEPFLSDILIRGASVPIAYWAIGSVKPFKSKNRDIIDLDATNPNLKKGSDRNLQATA